MARWQFVPFRGDALEQWERGQEIPSGQAFFTGIINKKPRRGKVIKSKPRGTPIVNGSVITFLDEQYTVKEPLLRVFVSCPGRVEIKPPQAGQAGNSLSFSVRC
jgi:hypothetical protein